MFSDLRDTAFWICFLPVVLFNLLSPLLSDFPIFLIIINNLELWLQAQRAQVTVLTGAPEYFPSIWAPCLPFQVQKRLFLIPGKIRISPAGSPGPLLSHWVTSSHTSCLYAHERGSEGVNRVLSKLSKIPPYSIKLSKANGKPSHKWAGCTSKPNCDLWEHSWSALGNLLSEHLLKMQIQICLVKYFTINVEKLWGKNTRLLSFLPQADMPSHWYLA